MYKAKTPPRSDVLDPPVVKKGVSESVFIKSGSALMNFTGKVFATNPPIRPQ